MCLSVVVCRPMTVRQKIGSRERSMVSMADMRISRESSMVSMRPGRPEGGQKQEMPVKREKEAWSVWGLALRYVCTFRPHDHAKMHSFCIARLFTLQNCCIYPAMSLETAKARYFWTVEFHPRANFAILHIWCSVEQFFWRTVMGRQTTTVRHLV